MSIQRLTASEWVAQQEARRRVIPDHLRAAHGILYGVLLSLVLWGLFGALFFVTKVVLR
jgi:hypothetical protein